jgi:aconitate hydratase
MPSNVTQTLISSRLKSGSMIPGNEIALHIDQVLLQDVLGGVVMLELSNKVLRSENQGGVATIG